MKRIIKKIPIVGPVARRIYRKWINPIKPFTGSESYWIDRYDSGGNSGDGSYNKFAKFKAEIINQFVLQNNTETIIEYGCGDGNQLMLATYPAYIGFDVSQKAIAICKEKFGNDPTKKFKVVKDYNNESAELTLSLDVIYHLIEDEVFHNYMNRLFDSSSRFVIIYASDTDVNEEGLADHVKHRNFTKWVEREKADWALVKRIPNRYPFKGDSRTGSFSDFFIYVRK